MGFGNFIAYNSSLNFSPGCASFTLIEQLANLNHYINDHIATKRPRLLRTRCSDVLMNNKGINKKYIRLLLVSVYYIRVTVLKGGIGHVLSAFALAMNIT